MVVNRIMSPAEYLDPDCKIMDIMNQSTLKVNYLEKMNGFFLMCKIYIKIIYCSLSSDCVKSNVKRPYLIWFSFCRIVHK